MGNETSKTMNQDTLIGYTSKRGNAWHYRASDQGTESNHFEGAIPADDVHRRLFHWEGVEGSLETRLPDGRVIVDPTRKVIARSDTGHVMGVFKSGYQIHQYGEWLVKNLEFLTDADLAIGSAGLLKGGAVAWVQVEMEETISVQGVEFRPFLTAATSMDGSLASTYQTGAQVVVCDNTLSAALGDKSHQVKIRHSKRSLDKYQDVREALAIVHSVADDFAAQVEALTNREVSDQDWSKFVTAYTDTGSDKTTGATIAERRRDELAMLWNKDERVAPWAGTAWGVVSAVNTHVHHVSTVRGATRSERNMERMVKGDWNGIDTSTLALLDKVQEVNA